MPKEKIVLVTAGGHIASFHSAMRAMLKKLKRDAPERFELVGANGGLIGLIRGDFIPILYDEIEVHRAGSMIGADRELADTSQIARAYNEHDVYAVIMMGGDNHLGEADKCHDVGLNMVGWSKTMDGDLSSFITLGWPTAVTVGATKTREHYHTAVTNGRVFYVGLFGRNTDWTLCGVTLYGTGDGIGIPCEQEYEWKYVWEIIKREIARNKDLYGVEFAVVPYSEGVKIKGIDPPPPKHRGRPDKHGNYKLQPEWAGLELVRLTKGEGMRSCFEAHTYSMRDSPPTNTDIILSEMAGEECIQMVLDGDFGKAVIFKPDGEGFYITGRASLEEVSTKRPLKPSGYFDYNGLKPQKGFLEAYHNLFSDSLGNPPKREDLLYKNRR